MTAQLTRPELAPHLRVLLDAAAEAPVELCAVDEAQLLAVGWDPPGRGAGEAFAGSASPNDFDGRDLAQLQLCAAGLARYGSPDPSAALGATGALRDYFDLIARRLQTSTWLSLLDDGREASARVVRRITPIRGTRVALLERLDVPAAADAAEPLPVIVMLVRVSDVAQELAELAFRPPASRAEQTQANGVVSLLVGPAGDELDCPSRLTHLWGRPNAVLEWRHSALFGRTGVAARDVTKSRYGRHLLSRLQVPEPRSSRRHRRPGADLELRRSGG